MKKEAHHSKLSDSQILFFLLVAALFGGSVISVFNKPKPQLKIYLSDERVPLTYELEADGFLRVALGEGREVVFKNGNVYINSQPMQPILSAVPFPLTWTPTTPIPMAQ